MACNLFSRSELRPGLIHAGQIALLPLLFVGCARFESHPISPADSANTIASRSLTNDGLRSFLERNTGKEVHPWPPPRWTLDLLTSAAFYYSPQLQVARSQWETAQAEVLSAGGRLNPSVNLGPGFNSDAAAGVNPWMPFVNFDWPVETAGKRKTRLDQAREAAEAARLSVSTAAWQVRSTLRSNLIDLLAAQETQSLLRRQLQSQEAIAGMVQQRVAAGAATRSELTLIRVAIERLRLAIGDAQQREVQARNLISETIGVPLSSLAEIEWSRPEEPDAALLKEWTSETLRRQALTSRPDVLGALAEYRASEAALQLEIARQYPDIHINPGYQWDQGESKWQIGVGVELPVLNRNQGPIRVAEKRRQQAAARFVATQAKVLAEIDGAVALVGVAQANLQALEALRAAQLRESETVAAQRKAGVADHAEELTAEIELTARELSYLDGLTRFRQATGALEDALKSPMLPSGAYEGAK